MTYFGVELQRAKIMQKMNVNTQKRFSMEKMGKKKNIKKVAKLVISQRPQQLKMVKRSILSAKNIQKKLYNK